MSLSKIKQLGRESVLYGISGVISRMLSIFLMPIYTRIFLPADYGVLNLVNTTFFLIGLLASCALDNAVSRWYYDTTDERERKKNFATWFWYQLGLSIILGVLLMACLPLAARYLLHMPVRDVMLLWLLPCINLLTGILPNIIWNWYRLRQKPKTTIVYSLSQSLLTISLTILFVVVLRWGLPGVFAALLISSTIFSAIAYVQIHTWLNPRDFDLQRLKELLKFSLPMIPAAIAYWLLNSTDAYFIQYFKGKAEVGLFSIGAGLASGVALLTGAFQQAWGPFAFSISGDKNAPQTYANVFVIFSIGSSILVTGMFLFSPELLRIVVTPQYYSAAWVASILSINIVLITLTYIFSIGASIAKNTTVYSISVMIAALITVVLDIILIPIWGKEGSAVATVIAQIFVPIYVVIKSQKLYYIPYNFKISIFAALLAVVLGIIGRSINIPNTALLVAIKFGIIAVFAVAMIYLYKFCVSKIDPTGPQRL